MASDGKTLFTQVLGDSAWNESWNCLSRIDPEIFRKHLMDSTPSLRHVLTVSPTAM